MMVPNTYAFSHKITLYNIDTILQFLVLPELGNLFEAIIGTYLNLKIVITIYFM